MSRTSYHHASQLVQYFTVTWRVAASATSMTTTTTTTTITTVPWRVAGVAQLWAVCRAPSVSQGESPRQAWAGTFPLPPAVQSTRPCHWSSPQSLKTFQHLCPGLPEYKDCGRHQRTGSDSPSIPVHCWTTTAPTTTATTTTLFVVVFWTVEIWRL